MNLAPRLVIARAPRWVAALLAALALTLLPVGAIAQDLSPQARTQIVERAEELVRTRAYAAGIDFDKRWPELLAKYKDRIASAGTVPELTRVINRALGELGISHLELVSPTSARQLNQTKMVGIGITSQPVSGGVRVVELVDGAPAQRAGVLVGDEIVEVDGQPYQGPEQIRGEKGTKVLIKVRREDGSSAEFTITRDEFSTVRAQTLTPVGDDANVLVIPTFAAGYSREATERLIAQARKQPYLIIDLRNNGGGDFGNMIHLLSCLLPPRTVLGTQVSRQLAERFHDETGGDPTDPVAVAAWAEGERVRTRRVPPTKPYEGRVAVLINRASASASEIVAAALHELRDAPLVGSRTAGAVLVSTYTRVNNGFLMKVPLSEWVTIKGMRLEGNPLVADVPVETGRRRADAGVAVEKALERLKQEPVAQEGP